MAAMHAVIKKMVKLTRMLARFQEGVLFKENIAKN